MMIYLVALKNGNLLECEEMPASSGDSFYQMKGSLQGGSGYYTGTYYVPVANISYILCKEA
jgi:hypothetical protein